jgi:hypothetical protein
MLLLVPSRIEIELSESEGVRLQIREPEQRLFVRSQGASTALRPSKS